MKSECIFHYVLSILEGAISGICFYRARQTERTRSKVLLFTASAVWFACSAMDSLLGGQELRKMKKTNGGDDNE